MPPRGFTAPSHRFQHELVRIEERNKSAGWILNKRSSATKLFAKNLVVLWPLHFKNLVVRNLKIHVQQLWWTDLALWNLKCCKDICRFPSTILDRLTPWPKQWPPWWLPRKPWESRESRAIYNLHHLPCGPVVRNPILWPGVLILGKWICWGPGHASGGCAGHPLVLVVVLSPEPCFPLRNAALVPGFLLLTMGQNVHPLNAFPGSEPHFFWWSRMGTCLVLTHPRAMQNYAVILLHYCYWISFPHSSL